MILFLIIVGVLKKFFRLPKTDDGDNGYIIYVICSDVNSQTFRKLKQIMEIKDIL